jgi:hypothetical protein
MGGVYVSARIAADSTVGIAPSLRKSDGLSFGVERSADGAGVQDAHAARRPIVREAVSLSIWAGLERRIGN